MDERPDDGAGVWSQPATSGTTVRPRLSDLSRDGAVDDADPVASALCAVAAEQVGCCGVGLVAGDTGEALTLSAASDERTRSLLQRQLGRAQGPAIDAARSDTLVTATDVDAVGLDADAARHRVATAWALPLRSPRGLVGALYLWFDREPACPQEQQRIAEVVAAVGHRMLDVAALLRDRVETADDAALRAAQLQHALHSRVVIEQAKGVVAERLDLSVDEAFERLRRHARDRGEHLHEIARGVVDGGPQPL